MRICLAALAAAVIMSPLQSHADVHGHFSRALAALPDDIFRAREPTVFVNLHALSMVFGTTDFTEPQFERAGVGLQTSVLQAMGRADSATFAAKAGVAPHEIEFIAAFGHEHDQAVIWGGSRDFPRDLAARLPEVGFSAVGGAADLHVNGQLMQVDLSAVDAANPWIGALGQASLVEIAPSVVYQTTTEAALRNVTALPSALDSSDGQAFAALMPGGETWLMQGLIFSADFGRIVGQGIASATPVYKAGLLADLQGPQGPIALLALSYDSCAEAEQALLVPWPQDVEGAQGATVQSGARCLALWRVPGGESVEANTAFLHMWHGMLRWTFAPVALNP